MSLASALLAAGALGWIGFWLLDRHWYHRLLIGAVAHGKRIEQIVGDRLPLGLTAAIETSSHLTATKQYQKLLTLLMGTLILSTVVYSVLHAYSREPLSSWFERIVILLFGSTGALVIRPVLLSDWTLKARNRIDIFYSSIFVMLLTLAWIVRAGIPKP